MSIRMQSMLGAIVLCVGLLLTFAGMLGGRWSLLIAGLTSTFVGLLMIVLALRQVSHEIGAAQSRLESQLRDEIEMKREQLPPK